MSVPHTSASMGKRSIHGDVLRGRSLGIANTKAFFIPAIFFIISDFEIAQFCSN